MITHKQQAHITDESTLSLSLSFAFYNKQNLREDPRAFVSFDAHQLSRADFVSHVLSGKAWAPGVFDGRRRNENWRSAQLIAVDYDDNVSVADALAVTLVADYALLVHPSASSTPEHRKTRVVFALDAPITGAFDSYRLAARAVCAAVGLEADPASFKPAQPYYGSDNASEAAHVNLSATLPLAVVRELARPIVEAEHQRAEALRKEREAWRPLGEADGSRAAAYVTRALENAYSALASATTDRTGALFAAAAGLYGLVAGGWPITAADVERACFNGATANGSLAKYGERELRRVLLNAERAAEPRPLALPDEHTSTGRKTRQALPLEQRIQPVRLPSFTPTHRVNERWISSASLELFDGHNLIIVKSPTGTGKTELGRRIIERWRAALGHEPRVLIVTHRRALVHNLAERYGVLAYDSFAEQERALIRSVPQVATTYDSLPRLAGLSYDVVIIDEVQQVMGHTFGGTFKGGEAAEAYSVLKTQINTARQVFAFDAGATDEAQRWLADIRPAAGLMALQNEYSENKGQLTLFDSLTGAYGAAFAAIDEQAGPVVVACSTKAESRKAAAMLTARYGEGSGYLINSDNSEGFEAQAFIGEINERLASLRWLVFSPSLGTGVDITARVRLVVGLFANKPLTPPDFVQLLGRCRHADERAAYVQPYQRAEALDFAALYWRAVMASLMTTANAGAPTFSPDVEALHALEASLQAEAEQYADYLSAFAALARADGYRLAFADGYSKAIADERKAAGEAIKEADKLGTLAAEPVSDSQLDEHRRAGTLRHEHRLGNVRFKIEALTGWVLDGQQYADLHTPDKRLKVHRLADMLDEREALAAADRYEAAEGVLLSKRKHRLANRQLMQALFKALGARNLAALPAALDGLTAGDIERIMAGFVERYAQQLEALGWRPGHHSTAPVPLLRWILARLGLKLARLQVMREGERFMVYSLDSETFERFMAYARAQLEQRRQRRLEAGEGQLLHSGKEDTVSIQNVVMPSSQRPPTATPSQFIPAERLALLTGR